MAKAPIRIKTYYGIPVPPWRTKKTERSMTLVFVITGRIPSKKNELVAVVDRTEAFKHLKDLGAGKTTLTIQECRALLFKTYGRVVNSKDYQEWENKTVDLIKDQLAIM